MAAAISGRATSRYTVQQNAAINVTPFVDVMLVLLIIFMVAAPLATKAVNLDYPPTPPNHVTPPAEPTYISIQNGGAIFIGGVATTRQTLIADLRGKVKGTDPVLIRAESEVPYGDFMSVMNDLKGHGFKKVSLIGEDIH